MPPDSRFDPSILRVAAVAVVTILAACGPKPVVFTPTACRAEPCGEPVRLIGDDNNPAPEYPEIMRNVGIDGTVEAEFIVTPSGTVDTASVMIRSSTNRSFERNTMLAIDRWQFGGPNGETPSVPTRYAVRVEYRLVDTPCTVSFSATLGHAWTMSGNHPVLTVRACQMPRIPRNQIRPLTPSGGSSHR